MNVPKCRTPYNARNARTARRLPRRSACACLRRPPHNRDEPTQSDSVLSCTWTTKPPPRARSAPSVNNTYDFAIGTAQPRSASPPIDACASNGSATTARSEDLRAIAPPCRGGPACRLPIASRRCVALRRAHRAVARRERRRLWSRAPSSPARSGPGAPLPRHRGGQRSLLHTGSRPMAGALQRSNRLASDHSPGQTPRRVRSHQCLHGLAPTATAFILDARLSRLSRLSRTLATLATLATPAQRFPARQRSGHRCEYS